jgi:hypothetical protein
MLFLGKQRSLLSCEWLLRRLVQQPAVHGEQPVVVHRGIGLCEGAAFMQDTMPVHGADNTLLKSVRLASVCQ